MRVGRANSRGSGLCTNDGIYSFGEPGELGTSGGSVGSRRGTGGGGSGSRWDIGNDYEVLSVLGEGSFGKVFKARSTKNSDIVAVKEIKLGSRSFQEAIDSLELKALKALRHTHIVRLKELVRNPRSGSLYYIFEYVDSDLCRLLKHNQQGLPEVKAADLVRQLFDGLSYMHNSNFFHRDLKPENILYHSVQETLRIADLGTARSVRARPPFTDYVGTRWYRAPECLLRDRNYSSPVDIWAAGLIFAELLRGTALFCGSSSIDQLYKIILVLGLPEVSAWPEFQRLSDACRFRPPVGQPCGLRRTLPSHTSDSAVQLLADLLQPNPRRRLVAKRALEVPLLATLVTENSTHTREEPPGAEDVRAAFEAPCSDATAQEEPLHTSVAAGLPLSGPDSEGEVKPGSAAQAPSSAGGAPQLQDLDVNDLDAELDAILNGTVGAEGSDGGRKIPQDRARYDFTPQRRHSPDGRADASEAQSVALIEVPASGAGFEPSTSHHDVDDLLDELMGGAPPSNSVPESERRTAAQPFFHSTTQILPTRCAESTADPLLGHDAERRLRDQDTGPHAATPSPHMQSDDRACAAADEGAAASTPSPETAVSVLVPRSVAVAETGRAGSKEPPEAVDDAAQEESRQRPLSPSAKIHTEQAEGAPACMPHTAAAPCRERFPEAKLPPARPPFPEGTLGGGSAPVRSLRSSDRAQSASTLRPLRGVLQPLTTERPRAPSLGPRLGEGGSRMRSSASATALVPWPTEELVRLKRAVKQVHKKGIKDKDMFWKEVSDEFGGGRAPKECKHQYRSAYKAKHSADEHRPLEKHIGGAHESMEQQDVGNQM